MPFDLKLTVIPIPQGFHVHDWYVHFFALLFAAAGFFARAAPPEVFFATAFFAGDAALVVFLAGDLDFALGLAGDFALGFAALAFLVTPAFFAGDADLAAAGLRPRLAAGFLAPEAGLAAAFLAPGFRPRPAFLAVAFCPVAFETAVSIVQQVALKKTKKIKNEPLIKRSKLGG